MRITVVAGALWGVLGCLTAVVSPAWAGLDGPASLPPPGYQGLQFVDANGCLFLRAGSGAKVVWVPMVDDAHRPICGMAPTAGGRPAPDGVWEAVAPRATEPGPPPAPPPKAPAAVEPAVDPRALPAPPKGWKPAWKDGRLNPLRGIGTAEGQAQQDQIWSRTVPARLLTAQPAAAAPQVRLASASAPGAEIFLQLGGFAVPANAQAAQARLAALGLPGGAWAQKRGAQTLQVVLAGPFAGPEAARAALALLRAGGFPDAFIR